MLNEFLSPPIGESVLEDFNMVVHLELEKEKVKDKKEED